MISIRTRARSAAAAGAALVAADSDRRSKILAETGEKAHPINRAPAAPAEASTESRVAATSAVSNTIASGQTQDRRNDQAAGPGTSKSSGAGQDGGTYTVVKGDTLSSIAKTHSVEVSQLREWNNLKSDNIKLGQKLRVSSN